MADPQTEHPPDVMTVLQLASYLNISRRTLDDMIAAGTAPPYRVLGTNTRRWLKVAVDEWLASAEVARNGEGA